MSTSEVNPRWQTEMAPLSADPARTPDAGLARLTEVVNLDSQLARLP